jgi:glutathione S-transferase
MKLYYSPGSCSLAAHIVLEESGAKFDRQRLNLREADQRKPEYLKVNPKGKVPALLLDDGHVLTENPAIMGYVADNHPQSGVLPAAGSYERARAQEWLAWCASSIHPAFGLIFGAGRMVDGEEAQANLKAKARANLQAQLDMYDQQLAGKPFVLGEKFSAADSYTIVFYRWARGNEIKVGENIKTSVRALLARPGVQRALETQGIKVEI